MTNAHARPPKPKKKHRLREAGELAESVNRNAWADPIGGTIGGKVYFDPRLNKPPKSPEKSHV
jgi:hypothetical protein